MNSDNLVHGSEKKSTKFTLAHIGSMLTGRNPKILWEVLAELIREQKDFANDFKLVLAGVVSNEVLDSINTRGLKDFVELPGYIAHHEVHKLQYNSSVLLLIAANSPDISYIIPGKLFEYMASGNPILAFGPEEWDVKAIVAETKTGFSFKYTEKQQLKEKIVSFYQDFKSGSLKTNPNNIEKYHRKSLTAQLAKLIKST